MLILRGAWFAAVLLAVDVFCGICRLKPVYPDFFRRMSTGTRCSQVLQGPRRERAECRPLEAAFPPFAALSRRGSVFGGRAVPAPICCRSGQCPRPVAAALRILRLGGIAAPGQIFEARINGLKNRRLLSRLYEKCNAGLWGLGSVVPTVRLPFAVAIVSRHCRPAGGGEIPSCLFSRGLV